MSAGNVVVVGAQWGDEGKGKVVDLYGTKADYIVRYQGGNNAGPHARRQRQENRSPPDSEWRSPPRKNLHHRERSRFRSKVFFEEIESLAEGHVFAETRP